MQWNCSPLLNCAWKNSGKIYICPWGKFMSSCESALSKTWIPVSRKRYCQRIYVFLLWFRNILNWSQSLSLFKSKQLVHCNFNDFNLTNLRTTSSVPKDPMVAGARCTLHRAPILWDSSCYRASTEQDKLKEKWGIEMFKLLFLSLKKYSVKKCSSNLDIV